MTVALSACSSLLRGLIAGIEAPGEGSNECAWWSVLWASIVVTQRLRVPINALTSKRDTGGGETGRFVVFRFFPCCFVYVCHITLVSVCVLQLCYKKNAYNESQSNFSFARTAQCDLASRADALVNIKMQIACVGNSVWRKLDAICTKRPWTSRNFDIYIKQLQKTTRYSLH